MTTKTKNVVSIVVGAIPSAMLLMSAFMKLSDNPKMEGLKQGFGSYVTVFGIMEILFVILFFIPKTQKIGFLLICSYLGGAMSIELSHGMPPMSAVFIALFWISVFIKDRSMFLPAKSETSK